MICKPPFLYPDKIHQNHYFCEIPVHLDMYSYADTAELAAILAPREASL